MSGYNLSKAERETIINTSEADGTITYYTSYPPYVRWVMRMYAANPQEVTIVERYEYGIKARMPRSWFRQPIIPRPARVMTDEQRNEFAERMRASHSTQRAISVENVRVHTGHEVL